MARAETVANRSSIELKRQPGGAPRNTCGSFKSLDNLRDIFVPPRISNIHVESKTAGSKQIGSCTAHENEFNLRADQGIVPTYVSDYDYASALATKHLSSWADGRVPIDGIYQQDAFTDRELVNTTPTPTPTPTAAPRRSPTPRPRPTPAPRP